MEGWLRRELYEAAREWEEEHREEIINGKIDDLEYEFFIAGAEYFLKEYCKKAAW
jgi:hypothetical protein